MEKRPDRRSLVRFRQNAFAERHAGVFRYSGTRHGPRRVLGGGQPPGGRKPHGRQPGMDVRNDIAAEIPPQKHEERIFLRMRQKGGAVQRGGKLVRSHQRLRRGTRSRNKTLHHFFGTERDHRGQFDRKAFRQDLRLNLSLYGGRRYRGPRSRSTTPTRRSLFSALRKGASKSGTTR